MKMTRLPAPASATPAHRPASGRIHRPASARAATGLGSVAGRRAAHAAVAGADALPRLLSAVGRAQRPAAPGAGRSQIVLGRRDTLLRWLQTLSADPEIAGAAPTLGAAHAPPVRDAAPATPSPPSRRPSPEDRSAEALVVEDLEATDREAATAAAPGAASMTAALAGAVASRAAVRDAPPTRLAWEDVTAEQRAPWQHAWQQQAALAALSGGTASRAQRDFLIEEIRRQVPDVAYLAQAAAGARTVLSLIIPGNRQLGLKTLNDHLVGYQINNSMIGPPRNQAVKNAFLGVRDEDASTAPFAVPEQTYKLTTVTSPRPPRQLGAALTGALETIDRDVPPIYQRGLEHGLKHWCAERDTAVPQSRDRQEAERRVDNIQGVLALVEAPGFQLDFQFGLAEIGPGAGSGPSGYAAALAAHMQSSQAALMRRDPGVELTSGTDTNTDVGDPRGQIYDAEAFLRFNQRGEALREQVIERGNTLTHHGHAYHVFAAPEADGEASRDVLRDVRKEKIQPENLAPGQAETLRLFERYFVHANVFDSIRPFTSEEVTPVSAQIERAQRLIDRLQGDEPIDASAVTHVLHHHPAIGDIIPTIDTAAEAVFYNAERTRTHRIIMSCDVRDMGVDVVQSYARAMRRVGGAGEDPDRVALQASDAVTAFRRQAIALTRERYGALVAQAIDDARRRGQHELARELETERQPSLLMGGDEITLSVHAGMRPYLPRLAAVLMDPDIARARVAISTTGSDPSTAVDDHILAQMRADPAHSVLKDFEAIQRDLEQMVDELGDPARKAQAAAWLHTSGLSRLYAENEGHGIVLRRNDTGSIVDSSELRRGIDELMQRLRVPARRRHGGSASLPMGLDAPG